MVPMNSGVQYHTTLVITRFFHKNNNFIRTRGSDFAKKMRTAKEQFETQAFFYKNIPNIKSNIQDSVDS